MGKLPKREAGFSIVEFLLIVVIVVLIGGAGWYAYNQHHKAAGVPVTTSAATKPATSSTKKSTTTHSQPTTNYFTIKEWGVRAPYSGTDTLSYSIDANNPNVAWINSQQLANADKNCEIVPGGGNAGSIGRYLPTDNVSQDSSNPETAQAYLSQDFASTNSQPPAYAKVGGYYYIYGHGDIGCSTTGSSDAIFNQTERTFENLVKDFQLLTN